MKRTTITSFAMLILICHVFGQNQKPTFASNQNMNFDKFISGVKYAGIALNSVNQEQVDKQIGIAGFYYVAQKYLQELGFEYIALTSSEKNGIRK